MISNLPSHLSLEVNAAYSSMMRHPTFELSLGHRHAIYRALGNVLPSVPLVDTQGHNQRILLALLTVCYALPLWDKGMHTNLPYQVLNEILEYIKAPRSASRQKKFAEYLFTYWGEWELLGSEMGTTFDALTIGAGAIAAGYVVLNDEQFDPTSKDYSYSISQIDPYDYDTAAHIELVYYDEFLAAGPENIEKRQAFWQWWLLEAIPIAFSGDFSHIKSTLLPK